MAYIATASTSAPGDGSRTLTITQTPPQHEDGSSSSNDGAIGTLRLQGARNPQRVAWDEDVIDNEGCGRKSSKICCIYHKPRRFDESSSEESSDPDSDSSCDNQHSRHHHARNAHSHRAGHNNHNGAPQTRPDDQSGTVHQLEEDIDRNAYEIMPPSSKGKRKAS